MPERPHGGAGGFRVLRPEIGRLAFRPEACLPRRTPLSACQACARACPVEALHLANGPAQLTDHCLSCGQCVAACPTGALQVPGFGVAVADDAPARLDCYRVDRTDAADVRVPCLGGLGAADLLELHTAGGGRGPVLLDRGWCADCPLGGPEHPAQRAIEQAADLLAGGRPAEALQPRIETAPLPSARAQAPLPGVADEAPVSRRDLLRRLAGQAGATARVLDDDATPAHTAPLRHKITPRPRTRMLNALAALGVTPPPALTPRVTIHGGCQDHGVCAALCPTGALHRGEEADGSGLDFDPAACIACQLCQQACPEQALTVTATGGAPAPHPLTRHAQRPCADCQRTFPAAADEALCPACRKSREFARDAAQRFRPPRPGRGSDATDPQEESA
ncbi:4Fe-4S binding protein [Halorhodospira halophila]|uniref:4Fe-4S ferredoxin, iron-sulfur binding domain protein n=1 Tax=Halorhodospira halophila (strain DSM 244 / SL1) TaxID=349124 RepID=A1WTY4_HALHL|nr:4Fe-4S binding protein [Halorhodospira halophila]ABM61146.1 4Fe-4S ferredoxin, iron-sulfur binding domain protein [Halorhodospira halophila SL1]MBK1729661.1 hypothetical protein [Halorhodospira halophila]